MRVILVRSQVHADEPVDTSDAPTSAAAMRHGQPADLRQATYSSTDARAGSRPRRTLCCAEPTARRACDLDVLETHETMSQQALDSKRVQEVLLGPAELCKALRR